MLVQIPVVSRASQPRPQQPHTCHNRTHGAGNRASKRSGACQAQRSRPSSDPEDAHEEIVLSNWSLPEFWEGLTWDAAVPATFAVAMTWVLTDTFITSKLPEAHDAMSVLFWLAPCVLLDAVLWISQARQPRSASKQGTWQQQPEAPNGQQSGLATYQWQRREACKAQCALPPVQKNVLLLLQSCAQQFAIQGVLSVAAVNLLVEAEHELPGVLPQLPGLPGLTNVDPGLAAAAACAGVMVGMVSYRVRCSAHAFHPNYLERSTVAFMTSLGEQPVADASSISSKWTASRGGVPSACNASSARLDLLDAQHSTQVAAALAAGRQALLLTSCTMVFLQTDSILASVWVAYMVANAERRLSSM
eukprot:jgi/Ulvmu1/8102/UM004_0341.1